MLAPFLIMLREGMEAAVIVGIIATYLHRTGRAAFMPAVWTGVLLAVALSLFAGAALQVLRAGYPQKSQEAFEAGVAEEQALETVLPHLSRERADELAQECVELYLWDRLGSDN